MPPRGCGRQNRTAVRENRVRPRAKGKDRKTEAQQKTVQCVVALASGLVLSVSFFQEKNISSVVGA